MNKRQKTVVPAPVNVLMIGTGEYTTGYGQESAKSDKGAGVVALTMFDLKSRGKTDRLALCGGSHPSSVPTAVLISAGARRRIVGEQWGSVRVHKTAVKSYTR